MRHRPLAIIFLLFVTVIIIMKSSGLCLWQSLFLSENLSYGIENGYEYRITGKITGRTEKTNTIGYILSDSILTDGNDNSYSFQNILLYIPKTEPQIKLDSEICVWGTPELFENASNPGGFDQADYYAAQNCFSSVYAETYKLISEPDFSFAETMCNVRAELGKTIEDHMNSDTASVLCAMILGEKSELEDDIKMDYSASGLSHILSISGLHISLVGMALYRLLLKIRAGIIPSAAISSVITVFYCFFTGCSESAIRATVTFVIVIAAKCFRQNYDSVNALSLAGIIILAARPMSLFRAGFQLSFAAAFGAGIVYPVFMKKFKIEKKGEGKKVDLIYRLKSSILLWGAINLVTFPLVLYHYNQFPVYALAANLVFVPMAAAVIILGTLGTLMCLVLPFAGQILFILPEMILRAQILAGEFIRSLPCSMVTPGKPEVWQLLLSGIGIVVFVILIKRDISLKRSVFLLAFSIIIIVRLPDGFYISALDVGQGDCIVINTDDNKVFIVDSGSSSEDEIARYVLEPYLKSCGKVNVEGIFLTHSDSDHMNGIEGLFEMIVQNRTAVTVKNLILPLNLKNDSDTENLKELAKKAGTSILYVKQGDVIKSSETQITVLLPENVQPELQLSGNEGSMVTEVEYGDFSALLTGDIEGTGEDMLTEIAEHVDVLKVAHHGSRYSTSEAFLEKTSPEIGLISAPKNSRYGHPHKDTLERLAEYDVSWYQTGLVGAVTVYVRGDSFYVNTYKY